jgi:outer membrane protein OmpA-like peptidoglycan-associated protein
LESPSNQEYAGDTGIATVEKVHSNEEEKASGTVADTSPEQTPVIVPVETPVVTESKDAAPVGKPFVFRLLNGITGAPVTGLVRLQETEKSNQYHGYSGNEKVYVTPPTNRSGKWFVVCQVIGFKPFKRQLNYGQPDREKEITIGSDQEAIVPISLVRVKRGDYIEMDEVKFFSNSSILTPESERELKELLAMLQENPDYRIRLHGHTNGNQDSDIITLGESQNLFRMDPANKQMAGTAKELSSLRAETVKIYLVTNGIESSRVDTRGEGGKQMIFDPNGKMASGNDRVEVEVTRH